MDASGVDAAPEGSIEASSGGANDPGDSSSADSSPETCSIDDAGGDTPALAPPMSVAGLALWLDGDMGVVTNTAGGVVTWNDRSGMGNVFSSEYADLPNIPRQGFLNGHGAVAFDGASRVVLEQYPTPAQESALTFDESGFAVAVVFQQLVAPFQSPATVVQIGAPWMFCCPSPAVVVPGFPEPGDFLLSTTASALELRAMAGSTDFGDVMLASPPVDLVAPHLLVAIASPMGLVIRLEGQLAIDPSEAGLPATASAFEANQYHSISVGMWWGFELPFVGLVGELVVIHGDPGADLGRVESYLMKKYGL